MSRLVVLGDHRRPLWLDVLHRGNAGGRAARAVLRAVAAERPRYVLDTGDLVPGAFESAWRAVDDDFAELRSGGAEIDAVPGNHETYGVIPRSAAGAARMRPFLARFPRAGGARWGVRDYELSPGCKLRCLLLDSNRTVLTARETDEQETFIRAAVADADRDPAVRALCAAWHHPPFTNSSKYGDDVFVARSFLPALRASAKLAAVFCGHVHGYERFRAEGVEFVVTGGAGAHPHAFPTDHQHWRHTPAFDASALPHLHYVVIRAEGAAWVARARHVRLDARGGAATIDDGDRFELVPRRVPPPNPSTN